MEYEHFMKIAISEAETSLREGNNGFGAVIVKDGVLIASSHDRENTEGDPTSHAETNAIREAGKKLGGKLRGCALVSTHKPCPMCVSAAVWSEISAVIYGCSIRDTLAQGRKRIDIPCSDVLGKSEVEIRIVDGILKAECSVLYREDVRQEIHRLRNTDDSLLRKLNQDSARRRTSWFVENKENFKYMSSDLIDSGYRLLLERFRIMPDEAPIIYKSTDTVIFHSKNFCPTLEACRILGLDTRHICRLLNENSTDTLLKQIDRRLCFSRNYEKIRPYAEYCEEMISISR
jgi:tRNA(Arg) A34 adenosine deaminase TadA